MSLRLNKDIVIAVGALLGIVAHLLARYAFGVSEGPAAWPLYAVVIAGGAPLVFDLLRSLWHRQFGADLLAGISIVTSVALGEPLAGAIVVLMLSGGETLEALAVSRASAVLDALARRSPTVAHRIDPESTAQAPADVAAEDVRIGDHLVVFPHELCPVDGVVIEGTGRMDEAYLTGEPYEIRKAPGSAVISGAVNGESALTIRATAPAADSRYARIMQVMKEADENRPPIRRLADKLGAAYTPFAVAIALAAWAVSGEPVRFLAVLVVATPCPLLIGIPVALVGAVSLAAKRGIVIRDPSILERLDTCKVLVLDKTGTLTVGRPSLADVHVGAGFDRRTVLGLAASAEVYSKHPLARALLDAAGAEGIGLSATTAVEERPGEGMFARVGTVTTRLLGRKHLVGHPDEAQLPPIVGGLETILLVDENYAGTFRFRDEARKDGRSFIAHLAPHHHFERVFLVSGDRQSEVEYLAEKVGIDHVLAQQSPADKVAIVQREQKTGRVLFVGDGINDAPALRMADVGIALGQAHEVTAEAAGAVILDPSLRKLDELLHIGSRLRRIALQSAVGGMALSAIGMAFAFAGFLPPVAGAIVQEIIDLAAVLNAVRMSRVPESLTDFEEA